MEQKTPRLYPFALIENKYLEESLEDKLIDLINFNNSTTTLKQDHLLQIQKLQIKKKSKNKNC